MKTGLSAIPLLLLTLAPWKGARAGTGTDVEFFETQVRPLLVKRCYECHSAQTKLKGGLALDTQAGWAKGGETGPAIVPGNLQASLLVTAVSYVEKDLQMPPKHPLPPAEVEVLKEWVRRGAPDPRSEVAGAAPVEQQDDAVWQEAFQKRLDWWSLQPIKDVLPPQITGAHAAWPRDGVDAFVLSALDAAGLAPAKAAEPAVLLRRLALVLTGLPPSVALQEQFMTLCREDSDKACRWAVDELLASPHFGEHFARHWMDVVRYTDTYGYEWDNPAKGSWEYRDYLTRAFNGDIGYDQMIREQLAGDLLEKPRINAALQVNESLAATMFYHLGEHRHGSSLAFNGIHQDMLNNKIDAFSKAFLATTVACARCHDHKLEAVSQRDYYALGAVFMTPRWTSRVVDAPGCHDDAIARLKKLRVEIRKELAHVWRAVDAPSSADLKKAAVKGLGTTKAMHDPAYVMARLLTTRTGSMQDLWLSMADEWKKATEARAKAAAPFHREGDVKAGKLPAGWVTEGDGIKHGHVGEATPLVALEGEGAITTLLAGGYHSHALSSKLPGAIRTPPQHLMPGNHVSLHAAGGSCGGMLFQASNSFQNEAVGFYNDPEPVWKQHADSPLKNGVQRVTMELTTAALNPNFPPRPGLLPKGVKYQDFGYEKRSWISLTDIVSHDPAGTPPEPLAAYADLFAGAPPATDEEAWQRVAAWLQAAVQRWCYARPRPEDRRLLNWLLDAGLLPNQKDQTPRLARLVHDYRRVEMGISYPRTVNGMDERDVVKTAYPLNVRGNVDMVGPEVQADFLQMFAGRNDVARSPGSGRLELAASLLRPDHPLTARVYVNRVWQWLFGTGLVATPDDFGRLGGRPSHPELLDYLARAFMRDGWSTKQLIRRLVLTQTFRQGSAVSPAALEQDPSNRLLHHYPTRRLEAEAVRDSLLAVAGRLDPSLYGHPILPNRPVEDGNKRLFTGPLDGHGRRSLYLQMSLMDPPKFLTGFNLPDMKLPVGRRDVTNVPTQALIMLNDPLVMAMAHHWAERLLVGPASTIPGRLREMFMTALGREPGESELARWELALNDFAEGSPEPLLRNTLAWERLAHALFNTQEFMYYR